MQLRVACAIHLAHAARAEQAENLVMRETGTGGEARRGGRLHLWGGSYLSAGLEETEPDRVAIKCWSAGRWHCRLTIDRLRDCLVMDEWVMGRLDCGIDDYRIEKLRDGDGATPPGDAVPNRWIAQWLNGIARSPVTQLRNN